MNEEYKQEYEKAKADGTLTHVSGIGILIEKFDKLIQLQDKCNLNLWKLEKELVSLNEKVESLDKQLYRMRSV